MPFSETFSRFERENRRSRLLTGFEALIESKSAGELEAIARKSAALTRQYFGRTMRLFAPLYLSNECVNNCQYCGFSRDNPILRVTLSIDEVVREARHLAGEGFRHILLVAGEHPKFVSSGYLESCIDRIREFIPSVAIEVGPMATPEYRQMVEAGAEGLVVYQETYDRRAYAEYHTAGPKRDFDGRLDCPERAYAGGFRRIGIGALLGLSDWRREAVRLASHLEYLLRHCWKANFTISLPRLRPAAGGFQPSHAISDAEFVRLICAFRIAFPRVGIVLSTRESPALRDALFPIGVTTISAGSHTEPGGYTGEGQEDLHLTVRGRRVELEAGNHSGESATGQFNIADERSPAMVADLLREFGLEPVWKDWDPEILNRPEAAPAGVPIVNPIQPC